MRRGVRRAEKPVEEILAAPLHLFYYVLEENQASLLPFLPSSLTKFTYYLTVAYESHNIADSSVSYS